MNKSSMIQKSNGRLPKITSMSRKVGAAMCGRTVCMGKEVAPVVLCLPSCGRPLERLKFAGGPKRFRVEKIVQPDCDKGCGVVHLKFSRRKNDLLDSNGRLTIL